MNTRQYLLVGGAIFVFAFVLWLANWFSTRESRSPIRSSTATQSFRAKSGTQRENARAVVRSTPTASSDRSGTRNQRDMEVWADSSPAEEKGNVGGPSAESHEEYQWTQPEPGDYESISALEGDIATDENAEDLSSKYVALGTMYMRNDPTDREQVENAFAAAIVSAEEPEEIVEATFHQAKAYLSWGDPEEALRAIAVVEQNDGPFSSRRLELGVLSAVAHDKAGRPEAAIEACRKVMAAAEAEGDKSNEVVGIYRQAALHLSRLLRKQGRSEEVESISLKLVPAQGIDRR